MDRDGIVVRRDESQQCWTPHGVKTKRVGQLVKCVLPFYSNFSNSFLLFLYIIFRMNFIIILIISGISVSFIADEPTISEGDYSLYDTIYDQDSTNHQYIDIRNGDNWCWRHNIWENVRIVNPSRVRRKDEE